MASSFNVVISKESQALGKRHSSRPAQLKVYNAVVVSSLFCRCDRWNLHRRHIKILQKFRTHDIHSILGIILQDRISNLAIFVDSTRIESMCNEYTRPIN